MRAKPYKAYKPSGVAWLGDVPEHWTRLSLGRFARRYAGGTPDRNNESLWEDGTIPWINSGAVNQSLVTEPSAFITEEAYNTSSARWAEKGDLVMALAGQGKTKGMVAQLAIRTTCNQSMAAICPDARADRRFLFWLLSAQYEQIRNMAGGEQRDGLNLEILGEIPCVLPPLPEQRAIATFLDRETGRIDTLVAMKRELIERLREKRTALISHAVTRGLDPQAKPKPSGLPWLGDIPANWKVLPFTKYVAEKSDYRGKTPDKQPEGVFLVTAKNVRMGFIDYGASEEFIAPEDYNEVMRRGLPRKRDILFTTEAPLGNVALVDREDVALAQRVIRFRIIERLLDADFVLFAMMSSFFQAQLSSWSTGSTAEGLKASKLPMLRIVAPELREQNRIAAYLKKDTAATDAHIRKAKEAIERLQEYRTALITAAVTGKIDVTSVNE